MQINWEKTKSYAKTAWGYFVRWALLKRHLKLFSLYIGAVVTILGGLAGLRISLKNNPDRATTFEVFIGENGWPEVCLVFLVTIAFLVIVYFMERKPFLAKADDDYKKKLDSLFESRIFPIRKLSGFINAFDDKGPFVNSGNTKLQDVFAALSKIIDGSIDNLYISAFSGMGKTRWICEAFKGFKQIDDVFYCDKVEEDRFDASFSALIEDYIGKEAIVVVDDCEADLYDKYLFKIQQSKCNIRLIGLNNDTSRTPKGVNLISFEYQSLEDVVSAIVDVRLLPKLKDAYSNTIIEYAEGIPYMAVLMIESLNKDSEPNIRNLSRSALCKRMIHLNPSFDEDAQLKAYQTISLFSPLGYEGNDSDQLSFVRDNDNITPIVTLVNRNNLFKQVISSGINQQIIEQRSTWINVRPWVLAVWLLEDWYKQCDDKRLAAIAQDIVNAPFGKLLIEAFGKRFSDMPDSPSAQKLVDEITKAGGSFRSEDVVCSDMGSRLFLSMATVNPVAVSDCLYATLFHKDIEWLKDYVKDDVRRNYVWALEKLCFRHDSFDKSTQLLARLAVAENETWANNATGVFTQLFHIALSGTQATPQERLELLKTLTKYGDDYNDIVILALNNVFNYGHFHRTRGAEKVGKKTLQEYIPTNADVVDYWKDASDFIEEWLASHPDMVDKVADAIVKQARQIAWAAGYRDILSHLIEIITKIKGDEWPEMAKELTFAEIHHSEMLSAEEKELLRNTIERLKNKDFISSLDEAHMRFYGDFRDFDQKEIEAEAYFEPCIASFISQKLHRDIGVISKLMDNGQQCDIFFIRLLARSLNEEQQIELFKTAIEVYKEGCVKNSSFINLFCGQSSAQAVDSFLVDLKENKLTTVYVTIISGREQNDLHVLRTLSDEYSKDPEWETLLSIYLHRAPLYDAEQMSNTYDFLITEMGDKADKCIADYIGSYSYQDFLKYDPMLERVKKFLVNVDEDKLSKNTAFELNHLADSLLKYMNLPDFAKLYNQKIIKKASSGMVYGVYDNIYFSLLPKYEASVLIDVLNALAEDNGSFWVQMMHKLGSGLTSGKGAGPLFQCDNNSIKQYCLQHAKTDFPQRIAHMIPIYEYKENSSENRFHSFVYWFLDNLDKFSDGKAILSALGANMSSFSWTGSTIPLWNRQKDCFTKLLNHKNPLVRDWAQRNVEALDAEIKSDTIKESYDYFRYKG